MTWTPALATKAAGIVPHSWWRGDSLAYTDDGVTLAAGDETAKRWTSKTASAKTLVIADSGKRPILKTGVLDGHSVLRFDGIDDLLQASTAADWTFLHNGSGHTLFIVWKKRQANADRADVLLDTCGASSANYGYSLLADNRSSVPRVHQMVNLIYKNAIAISLVSTSYAAAGDPHWHVSCTTGTTASHTLYNDGRAGDTLSGALATPSSSAPTYALTVGATGSAILPADADIAEIIIYDKVLSTLDRQQVFNYLRARYPSLTFGDVKETLSTVLASTYDSNDHNSFPSIVAVSDSTLLAFFRRATHHNQSGAGKISYCKSTSGGASWAAPVDILTPGASENWQEAIALRLSSGRILLFATRTPDTDGVNDLEDDWVTYSDDDGATWSTAAQITATSFTEMTRLACPVEAANGDILLPVYGLDTSDTNYTVRLLKSTDDGATWTEIATIADGEADSRSYTETGLAYYGSTLVAIVRLATTTGWWRFTSADDGATWSSGTSIASWIGGRPQITVNDAGHFFAVARDGDSGATRLVVSANGGANWQRGDDFGSATISDYGNCVHTGNGVGFVYGQEASDNTSASVYYWQPSEDEVVASSGGSGYSRSRTM